MNKWAVLGLGFISGRHAEAIARVKDGVALTFDPDVSKGADFSDWEAMTQSEKWKKATHVAVCAPNYLHYFLADYAARSGKKVLCEKPLVLNSKLPFRQNVFTVLQLRHHPLVKKLRKLRRKKVNVSLTVKVKRDQSYWEGWKGDNLKSGGILFNLGIHYFDLLIYLLGNKYKVVRSSYSPKLAKGRINFSGSIVDYHIEIMDTGEGQTRSLVFDGREVELSQKDNLSYEDLHVDVYRAMRNGHGVRVKEALKSIQLVERLKGTR